MKNIVCAIIAFVSGLSIAFIIDAVLNFVLDNTTIWHIFSERVWRTMTSIGRIALGWFFVYDIGVKIYYKLMD